LTPAPGLANTPPFPKEHSMGRRDSRRSPKMRRRKSQNKLKARIKRKIQSSKSSAAKKPAPAPSKKK
jgi:hypothetical protein